MSALFAKTIKQALLTFDQKNVASFTNNFNILKQLVNDITIRDLNLNSELFDENTFEEPNKAPCTYIEILQTKNVSVSVFILQKNYTMPLHDHPMMHGILKGISGKLLIQSYTKKLTTINEEFYTPGAKEINAICEPEKIITISTECAILTPKECNFHEITAVNGVAAFFDILSPPYDSNIPIYGRRKCSFYRNISEGKPLECILLKISSPINYYCDNILYRPPKFLLELIQQHNSSEVD